MFRAGIVGISGYSGLATLELLLDHPKVRVKYVSANNTHGDIDVIWPRLKKRSILNCQKYDPAKAIELCDCLFLAVPHTVSMQIVPRLLEAGKRVIDLSADYRLNRSSDYKKCYQTQHSDLRNLKKAVYGLSEIYRADIREARLIANPGCYPTAAILGLAPMASLYPSIIQSITIDAKSGVSGAGRKATLPIGFCEVNENFKAYRLLDHPHIPEIELYLSRISGQKINVDFVPHLLPVNRGILETIYVRMSEKVNLNTIVTQYKRFYKREPFVRIRGAGEQPQLKDVQKTNYCDMGFVLSADKRLLVITVVIDNLLKGAAGQAVQNMNIMYGLDENTGL